MSESLDGRVAIVVGATSGMGRATAVELARGGAVVTAAGRREERLDGLVEETSAQGLTVDTCVCDVTVEEEVDGLVEQVQEAHGRVDLMVYSTGTNIVERGLEVLTPETWDMMLATNLSGAFHATRSVLPAMRFSSSALRTCPTVQSTCIVKSPYLLTPLFPSHSAVGTIGVWGALRGK